MASENLVRGRRPGRRIGRQRRGDKVRIGVHVEADLLNYMATKAKDFGVSRSHLMREVLWAWRHIGGPSPPNLGGTDEQHTIG